MASLEITLFGSPGVAQEGTLKSGGRRNALALLAYLVISGEPQRRETLLTLLWPDHKPSTARAYLRRDLSYLKQIVGAERLSSDRSQVSVDLEPQDRVDVLAFRALVDEAGALQGSEDLLSPSVSEALEQAAETYTADLMTGFSLPDSPGFNEWLFFERESLRQELAKALESMVALLTRRGEYEPAIPHARRRLALDLLHEPAHRQLMQLYAWSGQQAAALRQYGECVRLLHEELGAEPEPATTELFEDIQVRQLTQPERQEGEQKKKAEEAESEQPLAPVPAAAALEESADRSTQQEIRHNLPVQSTPFIGRESELHELDFLLRSPDGRLVTIVGPGGMGKTRLAIAYAERQLSPIFPPSQPDSPVLPLYEHGLFFVDLAPLDAVEQIVPALAQAVGFPLRSGPKEERSPGQQIIDYLRHRSMLLLFDNFEHLLDGADFVSTIMKNAPSVRLLATSRERLHLHGEHLFAIQGLEFPDWETPEDAAEYTAVKLFLQSARRIRRTFELRSGDLTFLSRICRLVEGMPLAVELAAGWVDLLSLKEIAAEIEAGLDLLETEVRDVPRRQSSLRAVFDQTWKRLNRGERKALASFSIFRGGCTRDAAQEITGASLRMLAKLSDKSLIQYRNQAGRYRIHALLRQYAAEKLAIQPADEAGAREGHGSYFCAALARWERELRGAHQDRTIAAIVTDYDNVRAAWEWSVAVVRLEELTKAANGWGEFYEATGRWSEGETVFRRAAEVVGSYQATAPAPAVSARLLVRLTARQVSFNLNRTLESSGYRKDQEDALNRSLALLDGLASKGEEIRAEEAYVRLQLGRGSRFARREQTKEGRGHLEMSLRLYHELEDELGASDVLYELSWYPLHSGLPKRARELLRESLAILRGQGGFSWQLSRVLIGMGIVALGQGDYDEAAEMYGQAYASAQRCGHALGAAQALLGMESGIVHRGKFAEALSMTNQYLMTYNELGSREELADANSIAGFPSLYMGRYQEARSRAQKGYDLGLEVGHKRAVAWSSLVLGWVALSEEAFAQAGSLLTESVARCREMGDETNVAQAKATLAYAALRQGHQYWARQLSIDSLRVAIAFCSKLGILPLVHALPGIALLMAEKGDKRRAVELYSLAQTHPMVANSKWFEEIAGRHIGTIANTMPPDVVADAEARGRDSDLWETAAELLVELESWGEAE